MCRNNWSWTRSKYRREKTGTLANLNFQSSLFGIHRDTIILSINNLLYSMNSLSEKMVVDVAEGAENFACVRNGCDWGTFGIPEEAAQEKAHCTDCCVSGYLFFR